MLASCLIRISLCGFNLTSKSAAIRTPPCKTNFNIFLFVIDLHQVQPEARDEIQEIQGIALSDFTSMPVLADKIAQASDTKQMALQQNAYSLRPSEFFDFFYLIFFHIFERGARLRLLDDHTFLSRVVHVHSKVGNSSNFYEI